MIIKLNRFLLCRNDSARIFNSEVKSLLLRSRICVEIRINPLINP